MNKAFDLILKFLDKDVVWYECSEKSVTVELKDVNSKIQDMAWDEWLSEFMLIHNYRLKFRYMYDNFCNIHVSEFDEDEYILNKYHDRISNLNTKTTSFNQQLQDKGMEYLLKRQSERKLQ